MRKLFLGAVLLICLMQVSVVFAQEFRTGCCPLTPSGQPTSVANSCGPGKFILDKNNPETCQKCAGSQQCGEGETYDEEGCTCKCDSGIFRCKENSGGSKELICCSKDQCLSDEDCKSNKDRPHCNKAANSGAISCTTCVKCSSDEHCKDEAGSGKTSCLNEGEGKENPRCVCPWENGRMGREAEPTGSECCTSVGGTWEDGVCCVGAKKITKVGIKNSYQDKELNETCCKKAGGSMKDGKCCKCASDEC